ncbi:hypothetical protein ASG52_18215 [Methylobacterium sp. Leaf456]|uniref:ComEA family DNA-binding protein n=1 Tax=Methylobacterium sp. Leaf456 TaxID=1736382 RepID=UPI0006FF8E8B|nr:helix-hairpin-helix domain-containing protein [Methylobacterium sp. Leaf456]KQT60062.1 hypothetical protein ASG52_18215 [Methylobacterium sp. Leaf456]
MLSGSAILRVLLVLVAAAGIAGIVQFVWMRGTPTNTEPSAATRSEPSRPAPPPEPVPPEPAPPPAAEAPPSAPLSLPRREPTPPPAPAPAPPSAAPDPTEAAAENAPPAAVALVDLNTATLAELNGLKGGGAIGRTIIGHRPYTSVDQLLSKRVLNRATYQRIKDQVTVR